MRKRFGRLIFTNFFVNYFQAEDIEKRTEELFQKEIELIKNYLPKKAENIMDIGCGLGIINIFLNKIYNNQPNFFLLDKNRIDKVIKYGFSSDYESYNDLRETRNLLINNDIKPSSINTLDVEKNFKIDAKIDIVISLKSMGYHYPIDQYLRLFQTCCDENTSFIFDVSEGYYNESLFKKHFESVDIIYEEKSVHSLKRLFCTKFKIN
ncbi:hypothetical protein IDH29_05350 [Pelagibacterales bacterium SAG-MED06]|nr:hypothetical protein [Pelagibacterales bacterium SAG-MED06]